MLYLQGTTTLNMLVLTGLLLALVVVIDDAVVDVSHIAQQLRNPHNVITNQSGKSSSTVCSKRMTRSRLLCHRYRSAGTDATLLYGRHHRLIPKAIGHLLWLGDLVSLLVGMIVAHGLTLLLLDNRKAPAHYVSNSSPVISGLRRSIRVWLQSQSSAHQAVIRCWRIHSAGVGCARPDPHFLVTQPGADRRAGAMERGPWHFAHCHESQHLDGGQ